MAAKVVIVAVPTVLSIASIRVYTVREQPADGLIPREKLNIYTPLPQSSPAQFVPEKPGVIQSGLTAARERILPFVQAVKGACSSVKRGSVRLYHAGEDAYYYLKDPPPEFLPRFGTITMAGLLGMFGARKGSRFKRLAVPLGLMSAGVSVCYPAKAVAVVKVTGKKVYAAGQWSSAALSSLLTAKPQEPVTKESSQPQAATAPCPESAAAEETSDSAQSSAVPETQVVSAESDPVSEGLIVPLISEEASSVTPAEISPAQTPPHSELMEHSLSGETENFTTSEEIRTPADSQEPTDSKQAVEDASARADPAESVPSFESQAAPAGSPAAEVPPVDAAPVQTSPVEPAPVEALPSSEEPPAPKVACEPSVPVIEAADPPQVSAAEEAPAPHPQPGEGNSKGGSGFTSDPALMDFGQSSPEDEDLYSTRS